MIKRHSPHHPRHSPSLPPPISLCAARYRLFGMHWSPLLWFSYFCTLALFLLTELSNVGRARSQVCIIQLSPFAQCSTKWRTDRDVNSLQTAEEGMLITRWICSSRTNSQTAAWKICLQICTRPIDYQKGRCHVLVLSISCFAFPLLRTPFSLPLPLPIHPSQRCIDCYEASVCGS